MPQNSDQIVEAVLNAKSYRELEKALGMDYKRIMRAIHPDLCKHPRATEASAILSIIYKYYSIGEKFVDDSGEYVTNHYWARYIGMQPIIDQGRTMQQKVVAKATLQLNRYMPYSWEGTSKIVFLDRALPLSNLTLPQEHVNWVVSRLLEFCMLCHNHSGIAHMGLTPDNIFIVPEHHGVSVAGFYHATPIGNKVSTISAKYKNWYPASMFTSKEASEYVDLQMVKRIGAYLLGAKSGMANSLIRTHNKDFVNFLLSSHTDSKECFKAYRAVIDANFASKFIHLNI